MTVLNEQNIIERVAAETRAETKAPSGSAARPQAQNVHTASGVPNESTGYIGAGPGTA
jgi:hypothetical protein